VWSQQAVAVVRISVLELTEMLELMFTLVKTEHRTEKTETEIVCFFILGDPDRFLIME
jgi:hypothetical protein